VSAAMAKDGKKDGKLIDQQQSSIEMRNSRVGEMGGGGKPVQQLAGMADADDDDVMIE